jgi:CubicO group peptidase (beta-lactamase class C family)
MPFLPHLQPLLDDVAAKHDVPGAVVSVWSGGRSAEAATGVVNRNTGVATTTDSLFQIGSTTKAWTAALVMQLVDEGLIDLDRPVRRYLPEFAVADAVATEVVTPRHLLSHTAGFEGDVFEDTGRGDDALDRYLVHLHGVAQVHEPGAMFSYCNSGYCVLGALVARLRGGTYEEVLRDRLARPLGATHLALFADEAILFRAAAGHVQPPGGPGPVVFPRWQFPRSNAPAGATPCAAPRELVRFGRMLLSGGVAADGTRVLSEASVNAMRTSQVALPGVSDRQPPAWGLGLELWDWDGAEVFGHDGGTVGQSTIWRIAPAREAIVAMTANGGNVTGLAADLFWPVFEEVTAIAVPPPLRPPDQPARAVPPGLAGRYQEPLVHHQVTIVGGGLDITSTPQGLAADAGRVATTRRFVPLTGDTYIAVDQEDGRHPTVTFVDGGRYLFAERAARRVAT